MTMIKAYIYLAWWLMPPALVLWWARRWLLTPWCRYVSHTKGFRSTKYPDWENYFVTLRHVHWYPPFSDFDRTYRSFINGSRYYWANEGTGDMVSNKRDQLITNVVLIAEDRLKETDDLLKEEK